MLHSALNDRHNSVQREALLALHRLGDPKALPVAEEWLTAAGADRDAVRDLALRVVRESAAQDPDLAGGASRRTKHLPRVRELARHQDESIRRFAIVTLGEWRDVESRDLLQQALKDGTPLVKRAAELALKRLDVPPPAPPPPVETPAKAKSTIPPPPPPPPQF